MRFRGWAALGLAGCIAGCSGRPGEPPTPSSSEHRARPAVAAPQGASQAVPPGGVPVRTPPVFQPAFHQALRWSRSLPSWTTYRMKLPLGRGGDRIRVTFRAGDGALRIAHAYIGLAAGGGAFSGAPVPLTFKGADHAEIPAARGVVESDPVALQAKFHDDVYVSVALEGDAAASAINNFPDSDCYPGDQAGSTSPQGATACPVAMAVQTVETEAPRTRELLALGDSITEEFVRKSPDYRNSWPSVLEGMLGVPVLNSAVSGQGVDGPLLHLDNDVTSLSGVTDCIVLLGTNDLCAYSAQKLEKHLTMLYDALRPYCRVWTATLTPREVENYGDLATAQEELRTVNAWLRARGGDPVIDLSAATRDPGAPDDWLPAYRMDGVHPNYAGAAAMAQAAADAIEADSP